MTRIHLLWILELLSHLTHFPALAGSPTLRFPSETRRSATALERNCTGELFIGIEMFRLVRLLPVPLLLLLVACNESAVTPAAVQSTATVAATNAPTSTPIMDIYEQNTLLFDYDAA